MGAKKDKAIRTIQRAFPGSTVPIGTRLIVMGSESEASSIARAFISVGRAVLSLRKSDRPEVSSGFAGRTGPFSVAEEAETTQILSQGGPSRSIALLEREGDTERQLARPRAILAATMRQSPQRRIRERGPSQRDFDRA